MATPSSTIRAAVDPWYTAPLVPVMRRRRTALAAELDGDVLILTGPPAVLPAGTGTGLDHVVTVGWLAAAADLDATVDEIVARLAPGGWLHVIEPTTGTGAAARAQRLSAHAARLRTGWHIGRDLPAALRRAGLVVTDLERFSMPVSSTVLRPWVQGRARLRAVQEIST